MMVTTLAGLDAYIHVHVDWIYQHYTNLDNSDLLQGVNLPRSKTKVTARAVQDATPNGQTQSLHM